MREEDRKKLRPRIADAVALLRHAMLRRTHNRHQKTREESIMKCANQNCNHGIGLVAHRRGWFGKRRYCSRQCRDTFVAERPNLSQQERNATTYVDWLFSQQIEKPHPALMPA